VNIILQRYANREYRLTQQDILKPGRKAGDRACDRKAEKYAQAVVDTYVLQQNLESGIVGDCSSQGDRLIALNEWDVRRGIRSLDIIDEFRQIAGNRKNKGGWGFQAKPTKFGKNARHRVLEAGAVIDQEFGLNCYEVTLTVPGSLHAAFRVVANYSGWLCDRLLREVRRNPETQHWFYVWEWQKRGALHLHFAIASSSISDAKKAAQKLEYDWFELLLELSEKTNVDIFRKNRKHTWRDRPEKWQSHVSPIRKSCAAYFSKYAGKSSNTQPRSGYSFYPARWWGSSRAIKQGIEQRRAKYVIEGNNADTKVAYEYLKTWLSESHNLIKSYSYDFDLGNTKFGNPIGGGVVNIYYYDDEGFIRNQNWEPYVIQHVLGLGELDADIGEVTQISKVYWKKPSLMSAQTCRISAQTPQANTPSPSLHSQPSSSKGKLSKARGTQAKPALALRARLLQSLAGRDGEESSRSATVNNYHEQGVLFDIDNFSG
jgi:hypothetical protein